MKTAKIMATLGVAATLGISCIPMFATHAAAGDHAASATITITVNDQVTTGWEGTTEAGLLAGWNATLNIGDYKKSDAVRTTLRTTDHNVINGYKLVVYGTDNATGSSNLVNKSDNSQTIASVAGKIESNTVGKASVTGWGIQAAKGASGTPGSINNENWLQVADLKNSSTTLISNFGTTDNEYYDVYYQVGIKSDATLKSGDYEGNITFEIIPNPNA